MERNSDGKERRPRIGVGVMILNDKGQVLLGKRKASHGTGEWCYPGGHQEFGEKLFETARREALEETGLEVDDFKLVSVFDEMRYIKSDGKHYLNVCLQTKVVKGEPKVMEPDKCEAWEWFDLDNLPQPIFEPSEAVLIKYLEQKPIYSEPKEKAT